MEATSDIHPVRFGVPQGSAPRIYALPPVHRGRTCKRWKPHQRSSRTMRPFFCTPTHVTRPVAPVETGKVVLGFENPSE